MIILANVVPYGGNSVRYAMEKEKAKTVKVNHMPEELDATSIWYKMKHHCQLHQADKTRGRKLERFMVTFVVSPSKEESANFTMDDWEKLQAECLDALDSLEIIPEHMKEAVKTNFKNSMNVGALHSDSKSQTLHLHIDCCRVDLDGKTNDVHDIHVRAIQAAEIINMKHGWTQPQKVRDLRHEELNNFIDYTLRNMQEFDINKYFSLLRMKGYEVKPKYDKKGKLVGYTVGKNASVFKASDINRKYMVSTIENTWKKLHPQPTQVKQKPAAPAVTPSTRPNRPIAPKPTFTQPSVQSAPKPSKQVFNIPVGDKNQMVWIPTSLVDVFMKEAAVHAENTIATTEDVARTAMLLFAGYVDAATTYMESHGGGGGSSPSSGWGRDKDEDDWKFARRCLQMAHSMSQPKPKRTRGFRR